MTTESNQPLPASILASLIQTSEAVAAAIRLADNNVEHAGQISIDSLAELDSLLVTSWNHLDTVEPPYHMISELGGQSMIIHSSFVNEKNLAFLAFPFSTPHEIVDSQTDTILTSLKTFDLSTFQKTGKEKPAISDWLLEEDRNTQDDHSKDELSEDEHPTSFGSSPDPVISQTDVVNDLGDNKDPHLGEFPLVDVINLINKDEPSTIPSANHILNSTDDSEWQILENMAQEETENKPPEVHPVNPSNTFEVEDLTNAEQNGWLKQIDEDQQRLPQSETNELPNSELEPGEIDSTFFYLVPRINYHYLIGDLPLRLRKWVPEICSTYGWKLGLLSIRPDYLRWSLEGFPEYSVPGMLKILREETSYHIFTEFPGLKQENDSKDYWSSSYLIDRDDQHFSTQALILMISKDRLSK